MNFVPIPKIDGAFTLQLTPHEDARGFLVELWNKASVQGVEEWANFSPVQINFVVSKSGSVRGIHRTKKNSPQRKVLTCIAGRVLDVLVDLRPESSTFRNITRIDLDGANPTLILIPAGVGHGMQSLGGDSSVLYCFDRSYNPADELGINPLDETLGIEWEEPLVLSDKDADAPNLNSYPLEEL